MRVLQVVHDYLPRHQAGAELYAHQLSRELAQHHDVHILCAEYDPGRPHGTVSWRWHDGLPVTELVNNWDFTRFEDTYASEKLGEQLEQLLDTVRPDLLHIHSLLNLTFDLPRRARRRGIPSVATLHDYTLVCPSGGQRIHTSAAHVCEQIDLARCARCFPESPFYAQMVAARSGLARRAPRLVSRTLRTMGERTPALLSALRSVVQRVPVADIDVAGLERRMEEARRVFREIELFVAPSRSLAEEFIRLGLSPGRIEVREGGLGAVSLVPKRPRQDRLRLGFIGVPAWHKGVHILLEAVRQLPPDWYELTVHGDPASHPDYMASLRRAARDLPVRFPGPFENTEAPEIYAGLDVLVVPSLWPENSPMVIREARRAKVPVVAARIGGIAELVEHGVTGLLYEPHSAEELAGALRVLLEDPSRLEGMAAALTPVRTMADDALAWEGTYRQILDRVRPQRAEIA